MKRFIFLMSIFVLSWGALIPEPLVTQPYPIQQFSSEIAWDLVETRLFGRCWGISFMKIRNSDPEEWLAVISDPTLDDLVCILGVDSSGERYTRYSKGFDDWEDPQYFQMPRGLACDSSVFNNSPDSYFVYTADSYNNLIIRSYFDANNDTMLFHDSMLTTSLSHPMDVACVSIPSGGSYLIIADTDNHRIQIVRINSDLTYSVQKIYGSEGSGVGQFKTPTGVAMVQCQDSLNYYRLYVVDQGNYRIVSLLYNVSTNSITWERDYTDNTATSCFLSVTSNPYYCVYVTDYGQNMICVFTPGLTELLYTYGSYGVGENQFLNPIDLCIYQNEVAVTEVWASETGIQYFKIVPEIRDFYPESDTFDALIDSIKINFKVCETAAYLTMTCCNDTIVDNQYFEPGTSSVYWDGREGSGKPAVPGTHPIYIRCPGHTVGTAYVTIEGTKIEGDIADLHWTPAGNPYVLVENSSTSYDDTLIIDPGVLVMGHDTNSTCTPLFWTKRGLIYVTHFRFVCKSQFL